MDSKTPCYSKSGGRHKSISLKDVEIKPANDDQDSILNRHLDEIIYFFQSTKYDLVVIEDIDRFDDSEIFVTLREINSLVNENAGVNRTIRFLYALRDDMFANTDRTKFFEFIIPVIPIINTWNSIDMVLAQGRRLELDERLNRQFLREVSRYLNDLRLIHNIFNEYAVYVGNLDTDKEYLLDANKLLSVLIYKNVYPRDFEQLHRGEGTLAELLRRKDDLVRHGETTYRNEIVELEEGIAAAERQTPTDIRELRSIYAMALIEALPQNTVAVSQDQQTWTLLGEITEYEDFERLIDNSIIHVRDARGYVQHLNVSNIQEKVDSDRTYHDRKKEIISRAADIRNRSLRRIGELRAGVATLRTAKLNDLLRLNMDRAPDLFDGFGEKGDLARFLILEGHLDDTYYQYTSLFHEGRLSPNDNRYLIKIRAFETPAPSFTISNPKEVIAAMRSEDFQQSYVLNTTLVDALFNDPIYYASHIRKLFEFISTEFDRCEEFLEAYYESGQNLSLFLSRLVDTWSGLLQSVLSSTNRVLHVTQLVSHLPQDLLTAIARDNDELPDFVATSLPQILERSPEIAPERFGCLNFHVKSFAQIIDHTETVRFMFENGRFDISIANLEYIYGSILGKDKLEPFRRSNLTALRAANNVSLMERIESGFEEYFCNVLLELKDNSKEDASAVLEVLQHDALEEGDIRTFLAQQTTLIPWLKDVPQRRHALLFQTCRIKPTWMNCLSFIESEAFNADALISFLNHDSVRSALLEIPIPSDPESLALRSFLVRADSLSDASYRSYAHALPNPFKTPPKDLSSAKLRILIKEEAITFSRESFDAFSNEKDLQVLFVASNLEAYLSDPDSFAVDDAFREKLLRSELDGIAKLRIIGLMDLEAMADHPERAAMVATVIHDAGKGELELNGRIAEALITSPLPIETQISLFNIFHLHMTDDDVRRVLSQLPQPFSEIDRGHRKPKLKKTPENLGLVRWLDSRNIISSWRESGFLTDEISVNLYRR